MSALPSEPETVADGSRRRDPLDGARVLLVIPELALATDIACRMAELGLRARVAATAGAADDFLRSWSPDVVVVDLDTDGFVAGAVITPDNGRDTPAAVLMRHRAEPAERVRWLNEGASDFVPSPVSPDEVVARVTAVLRRNGHPVGDQWTMSVGSLSLDETKGEVEVDGRRRRLSPMEFKLLRHLAGKPGVVFARSDLLRDVWGYTTGGDATVTVHIRKLREKLEVDSERPRLIRTRRGVGYYLSVDGFP